MEYKWLYKIKYSEHDRYDAEYAARFNGQSTYHYELSVNNFPVFVVLNTEIVQLLTQILRLDKRLYSLERELPSVALRQFSQKCLIDEVKLTNELEGVTSTRREIKEVLDNKTGETNRLYGIVQKYSLLMTTASIPLNSCRDIRKLYDEFLLSEIKADNPENLPDGDIFRKSSVFVKNRSTGKIIHTGVYPETKITEAMTSLLSTLNNSTHNPLVDIAVAHYMFGYIHPFYDGNGRMSRFISSYLLSRQLEQLVGFRLAYTIKKDIKKYYKMFELTNDKINAGDLTPFTIYFLDLVKTSLTELVNYFTDKTKLLSFYQERIYAQTAKPGEYKEVLFVLTQSTMFGYDGMSIKELSGVIKKSESTTRKIVKMLENDTLLTVKKSRPMLYNVDLDKINEL